MSGLRESNDGTRVSDIESNFKHHSVGSHRFWKIPRRYQVAFMCYLAFCIKDWMIANLWTMYVHFLMATEKEKKEHFSNIGNWTIDNLETHLDLDHWGGIVVQFPAAALALLYSPHKIMLLSVLLSSLLHILTPVIASGPDIVLSIAIFFQGLVAGPVMCACISLWKEWAPVNERTSLLVLAFSGKLLQSFVLFHLSDYLARETGPFTTYYYAGIVGLVWCFIWNTLIYESPSNDPLITLKEQYYLEESVPSEYKEKTPLASVPLKSILTSMPVLSLCLMFFTAPFIKSFISLFYVLNLIENKLDPKATHWTLALHFLILLPSCGFLVDALINKMKFQVLTLRKVFCCGGFVLHALFLFLIFIPDNVFHNISYILAYIFLSLVIVGCIPNVLELSPRYACVIIAICSTISRLSLIVFDYVAENIYKDGMLLIHVDFREVLIPCGVLVLLSALVYAFFASSDEQAWSTRRLPPRSPPKDAKCYPKNDVDDDTLVTDL